MERYSQKQRYNVLLACGYEPKAAKEFIKGLSKDTFGDNLLVEQASEVLKRQRQEIEETEE